MDPSRLDDLARRLAASAPRRVVAKAAAGAVLASLVGAPRSGAAAPVSTERKSCRGTGEICRRDGQCCSDRCFRGRCDCRGQGAFCTVDRGCCSGRCGNGKCS